MQLQQEGAKLQTAQLRLGLSMHQISMCRSRVTKLLSFKTQMPFWVCIINCNVFYPLHLHVAVCLYVVLWLMIRWEACLSRSKQSATYTWLIFNESYRNTCKYSESRNNLVLCSKIWAATWQNHQNECAPSEDRSAWTSAQSDQSLRCALIG